jgi:hypothetical protein
MTRQYSIILKEGEEANPQDPLKEIFKDGKLQIFNSFFRMMINLKKHKREFSIVLRSFNNDLAPVIAEFNLYSYN